MTDLLIRAIMAPDVAGLAAIDHSYHTDFVWQMDLTIQEREAQTRFREIRLPRTMRVEYPRKVAALMEDWQKSSAVLMATRGEEPLGYASLTLGVVPGGAQITDIAVARRFRRQGVASALLRAAQTWTAQQGGGRIVLEMQSKNYPGICLAQKSGYEYCGYNDRYYENGDIAVFFARSAT